MDSHTCMHMSCVEAEEDYHPPPHYHAISLIRPWLIFKSVLNCEIIFPAFLSVHTASYCGLLLHWLVPSVLILIMLRLLCSIELREVILSQEHVLPLKSTCVCAEAAILIIYDRLLAMTGLLPARLEIGWIAVIL